MQEKLFGILYLPTSKKQSKLPQRLQRVRHCEWNEAIQKDTQAPWIAAG
jgi:hypothetical protein